MHNIIFKSTKKTIKYIDFVNPKIPRLSVAQSLDWEIAGIP